MGHFTVRGRKMQILNEIDIHSPKTNIAPKNGWLEGYFPLKRAYFQGLCSFQGGYQSRFGDVH